MNSFRRAIAIGIVLAATPATLFAQTPLGTEWTYQGQLRLSGSPVSDTADFRVTLWDDPVAGTQIGTAVNVLGVGVVDGLFTLNLDFGAAAFDADARWMQIAVRSPAGAGTYTTLATRQPLTAVPFALKVLGLDGHSLDAADGSPANALFVDNIGNVGVGTTTPAEKLTVSDGNVRVDRGASTANRKISVIVNGAQSSSTNPFGSLEFKNYDFAGSATDYSGATIQSYNTGSNAGDLRFATKDSANGSPVNRMYITAAGDVGIGVASPTTKLQVAGTVTATAFVGDGSGLTGIAGGPWSQAGSNIFYDGGNVGIGTSAATAPLTFRNADELKIAYWQDGNSSNRFYGVDMATGGQIRHWVGTGGSFRIGHYNNADGAFIERARVDGTPNGGRLRVLDSAAVTRVQAQGSSNGGEVRIYDPAGTQVASMRTDSAGNGVFDTSFGSFDAVTNGGRLVLTDATGVNRVNAQATANGGQVKVRTPANTDAASMYVGSNGEGQAVTYGANGNVNVQMTYLNGSPNNGFLSVHDSAGTQRAGLYVNGSGDGQLDCDVLQIFGGSDIAEPFNINSDASIAKASEDAAKPGMVVSIDPANPGELRLSTRAYDHRVAGVISGAGGVKPGMTLQQPGTLADGKHPVALTGRVWCHVDADANGAVHPGDPLTTSDTPGHAMKATDRDRVFGTCIGKAMTSLESGRGLVLVLVNLQ